MERKWRGGLGGRGDDEKGGWGGTSSGAWRWDGSCCGCFGDWGMGVEEAGVMLWFGNCKDACAVATRVGVAEGIPLEPGKV